MGARKCSVKGCTSCTNKPQDSGVTFHRFPVNQEITKKWLKAAKFPDGFTPGKGHHICSRHFCRSDFMDFKGKKYFLKQGSVPTIFSNLNPTNSAESTEKKNVDEIPKDTEKSESETKASEEKPVEKMEVVENEPKESPKKEDPAPKIEDTAEKPAEVVQKPAEDEKKPDPAPTPEQAAIPSTSAAPPVFSPKKKRRSAPIKRYSDNNYSVQEPAKKVPKRLSLPKLKEKLEPVTTPTPPEPTQNPTEPIKIETPQVEVKAEIITQKPVAAVQEKSTPKKKSQAINFVPGNTIEAQDFDGKWNAVKILEVDTEDREVLIRFDNKFSKSKQSG